MKWETRSLYLLECERKNIYYNIKLYFRMAHLVGKKWSFLLTLVLHVMQKLRFEKFNLPIVYSKLVFPGYILNVSLESWSIFCEVIFERYQFFDKYSRWHIHHARSQNVQIRVKLKIMFIEVILNNKIDFSTWIIYLLFYSSRENERKIIDTRNLLLTDPVLLF